MKPYKHYSVYGTVVLIFSVCILFLYPAKSSPHRSTYESGEWGTYELWEPASGQAQGLVFFFSAKGGFQKTDKDAASELAARGLAVSLVNTDAYLHRIDQSDNPEECLYLPGAVEWTSHFLQKRLGFVQYQKPYLLGKSEGAGIVYSLLAQGSSESFAGGLSIDFLPVIPLKHPLANCPAVSRTDGGQILDSKTKLCGWWHAAATQKPSPDVFAFVRSSSSANKGTASEITVSEKISSPVSTVFASELKQYTSSQDSAVASAIIEVSKSSAQKKLAVIYSGDGGWRDIDQKLGDYLAQKDIAVVGVNCLSYFWKKRSPEEVSLDLDWLLRRYLSRWEMQQVILIGYSFGADILPPAYNRLPGDAKKNIIQMSLLGLSTSAELEFHFSGWISSGSSADAIPLKPEVERIDKKILQCFYGEDDSEDTLCTDPVMLGAEIVKTAGGHHFDGSYTLIGDRILRGVFNRAGKK